MKKRILSLLLALAMLLTLAACGGGGESGGEVQSAPDSSGGESQTAPAPQGEESPDQGGEPAQAAAAEVTGPITITLWHTRGSGANGTEMDRVVKAFNDTNELGITLEAEYIGAYSTIMPRTITSIASGNNPVLVMSSAANITSLISKGVLADMNPYIQRDGFDMSVFPKALDAYCVYNGQTVTLPYLLSTCVLYYNVDLFNRVGVEPPETVDELVSVCQKIYETTGVQGFAMPIDPTYMQDALLNSLGGVGIIDRDGVTTSCLTNGSLEKLADDWRSWIEAGWCKAPNTTSSNTDMIEAFAQGKLACILMSSGSLTNILNLSEGMVNVGVAYMPGYGGYASNIGGANIAIIQKNHSDQEVAAAWEFLKFLMSDEQLALNAVNTGYLPVTTTSAQTQTITDYWAQLPQAKVGYDQLEWANICAYSLYTDEWYSAVSSAFSYVVQDRKMTGADAVDYLNNQYGPIFG